MSTAVGFFLYKMFSVLSMQWELNGKARFFLIYFFNKV